jgi:hypothetical protein
MRPLRAALAATVAGPALGLAAVPQQAAATPGYEVQPARRGRDRGQDPRRAPGEGHPADAPLLADQGRRPPLEGADGEDGRVRAQQPRVAR